MTPLQMIAREFEEKIAVAEGNVAGGFDWAIQALDQIDNQRLLDMTTIRDQMTQVIENAQNVIANLDAIGAEHKSAVTYFRNQLSAMMEQNTPRTGPQMTPGVLLVDKGIRYQNPRTFESLLSGSGQVNGLAPATARN